MGVAALSTAEREVVRRMMMATFDFFEWDFQTRLGVTPEETSAILSQWPDVDDEGEESLARLAINNSLNDLLNGVGISDTDAVQIAGVDTAEIHRIYRKWLASHCQATQKQLSG